jgi:hypothetical protein
MLAGWCYAHRIMSSDLGVRIARWLPTRLPVAGSAGPASPGGRAGGPMAAALAAVLLIGLGLRSLATIEPPLLTGADGAYYLVQVRAILRTGSLAFPDFPLLFYVQAAVASLLSLVMEQRAAIVAAVRLTDTVLPLALAVPVFLFARAFTQPGDRASGGAAAVALVGLVAVGSGHTLLMAGGVMKNAVALPGSFFFLFASYEWLRGGRTGALAWAVAWFVLASLTHMGGFILCAVFAAILIALGLATPAVRPRVRPAAVVLPACLAACLAVLYVLDPVRAQRLVDAAASPGWLLAGPAEPHSPGGGVIGLIETLPAVREAWLSFAFGMLGIVALWRHRTAMDASTRVLIGASTLATFALSLPLLRDEVLERLVLLAYVPAMIPAVYLICREAWTAVVVTPLVAVSMLQGALAVKTLRVTALVPAAYEELVRYRSALPPGRVIVIARPMLRWWVAWAMETHFSTRVEPALALRDEYDAVLVLDELRPGAFGDAPTPSWMGSLGAGVRDADRLRSEAATTLAEGEYFRLSRITRRVPRPRGL